MKSSGALLRRLAPAVAAAGAIVLFLVSRGKWSDALIDSGREWIVPDALARGDLLYRDVVYWFGPFTPYFHAAFFRVLGSGFGSLVAAGLVGAAAALAALHVLLRRVTGPREAAAWTALAIPVLVFMPNAGGPILGMGYRMWHAATFALLAVALAASPSPRRRRALMAAGVCVALAGLCRTEWGLAALCAASLTAWIRARDRRRSFAALPLLVVPALGVFGAVLGFFVLAAGSRAVLVDCHVLLGSLPEETRSFLLRYSGLPDWRNGLLELAYASAVLVGAYLAVQALASRGRFASRLPRLALWMGACLVVLALTAAFGGATGAALFSAAPLVSLAALGAGLWRRRGSAAAALAGAGALGVVLSYRRVFHIGDAAYVGPPLLFAFVAAAGLLRLGAARRHLELRRRLAFGFTGLVAGLAVLAFAARVATYSADDRVPIPGTDGMLSARPEFSARIVKAAELIRKGTPPDSGLAVFPEGEILNYLSGRRNPSRYKLYIPGYLSSSNEQEVLADLVRTSPEAVAVFYRITSEYGPSLFGQDYGRLVMGWVDENYPLSSAGQADRVEARNGARLRVGLRTLR